MLLAQDDISVDAVLFCFQPYHRMSSLECKATVGCKGPYVPCQGLKRCVPHLHHLSGHRLPYGVASAISSLKRIEPPEYSIRRYFNSLTSALRLYQDQDLALGFIITRHSRGRIVRAPRHSCQTHAYAARQHHGGVAACIGRVHDILPDSPQVCGSDRVKQTGVELSEGSRYIIVFCV